MCVFKTWKKSIYMSWNLYHCKNLTSLPWLNDQTQWLIQCKTLLHYEKCEIGAFALEAFLNSTYVNCTSNFTCHFNDLDKRHKFCQRLNSTQAIASCANIMYVLKCQKFVLISAIRGSLTCLKTLRVSRLSDSLNVTLSDAIFITGEEGGKKNNSPIYFCNFKNTFCEGTDNFPSVFVVYGRRFSNYLPARFFFNQMMTSRIFFTLKNTTRLGRIMIHVYSLYGRAAAARVWWAHQTEPRAIHVPHKITLKRSHFAVTRATFEGR